MNALQRLTARTTAPVDGAFLGAFRALFGVVIGISLLRFVAYGWVEQLFGLTRFQFKYAGFGWVPALPAGFERGIFVALAVVAFALALGIATRALALLLFVGFAWVQLVDVANYLNHYYLAALLLLYLAVAPSGRCLSVDAALARTRGAARDARIAVGWLWALRAQIGIVYTGAALAKFNGDWLLHGQPLGIWLAARAEHPLLGPVLSLPRAALTMSWAGFLFDLGIPWLLAFGGTRARVLGFVVLGAFHTLTGLLFPIGMFPVIMSVAALAFLPADWPRRLAARLRIDTAALPPPARPAGVPRYAGAALLAGVVYFGLQLGLPLRALFTEGPVSWHEHGMRFSWRVMTREKNASVTYFVRDPSTGRVQQVAPRRYLTPLQERELGTQPDLIAQLGAHIAEDVGGRLGRRVEVRAEALVSWNGRPIAQLVDPEIDLAPGAEDLRLARFVLPAPTGAPPPIRPR